MVNPPLLSFVIPVRNDAVRLARCLESIRADGYPSNSQEIIVLDNGSVDESADVARKFGALVLALPDLTVAELRNRGAAVAHGDILTFVDADHELANGWSHAAAETLSSGQGAAAGDVCHAPLSRTWVQSAYDAFRPHVRVVREVAWLGSGNLAVRADAFREAGGFDTTLVTCEDVDLCQRLRSRGHRIIADPRMFSVHYGDPATLRQLFVGELWRGQDNLKVSLRGPLNWAEIPSIAIPIVQLACLACVVVGLTGSTATRWGWAVAAAAAVILLSLSGLRAVLMAVNARPRPWWRCAQFYCVALVYDLARALALVVHRGHHRK
jgi:hypothetical protein